VRDGNAIRPEHRRMSRGETSLCYGLGPIDAQVLGQLRCHAYETGRVIEREGLLIAALGTAAALELSGGPANPPALRAAVAGLGTIPRLEGGLPDGGAETGRDLEPVPVALGALRFDRSADGALVVPEVTVIARAGSEPQVLAVGSPDRVRQLLSGLPDSVAVVRTGEATAPPDEFRLASARPHRDFLDRVSAVLAEIAAGSLDKLVLAREVTVHANRPFRQADLLGRLRALHPSCTAFALDGFIGATPELLISRDGARIVSVPLAGTAARSGDPDADRRAEEGLLESLKERSEHRVVVDAIVARLSPVAKYLEVPDTPVIRELRNVSHLGTEISGTLARHGGSYPSSLELVGLLHPTPAVAGTPVDLALDYLVKLEELDRDRYGGPVGWVDARGDGEWYIGIRSAVVEGSSARLFAGVGIVADSDPASELAETQLKLQAFLAAAVRP
jgi:menaquinone-specific isochorismate synthase